ncbi:MAG: ATP-dependent metallopeptidase FtsH/Yme1/Tma family protein, partial [Lachnospiraceae bacterium]|nr:ATP-dependent metallopeptidase FtsH/Yme1/Tma family protein [Lachnospiraceae bacterium]
MSDNNLNQYDGGHGSGGGPSNNNNGGNGTGGSGKDPRKQSIIMFVIAALLSLLLVSTFVKIITGDSEKEISYNEFIQMLEEEKVESVVIGTDRVYIKPKVEKEDQVPVLYLYGMNAMMSYYTGKIEDDDTLTNRLLEYDVEVKGQVADGTSAVISFLLSYVFPFLLMWVLLSFLFRKMSKG